MAVFTAKRLHGPSFVPNTITSVYAAPAGKTAVLKQIVFNNTSASNVSLTANLVPNSGSASTSNQIITSLTISGYSQIIWTADIPLSAGDAIHLTASASNAVTATASGIEIS